MFGFNIEPLRLPQKDNQRTLKGYSRVHWENTCSYLTKMILQLLIGKPSVVRFYVERIRVPPSSPKWNHAAVWFNIT